VTPEYLLPQTRALVPLARQRERCPEVGIGKSFERNKDNCAFRQAFARGSPARHRRMNSVINWLVALSLTCQ
jgi:hypothetical protein